MKVYLDNAATTKVDDRVLKAMLPYFTEKYGNASSLHSFGRETKNALEQSRKKVAKLINANPEEIVFTSGGTESNNIVIKGALKPNKIKSIVTSPIEHHAVLYPAQYMKKQGYNLTLIPVDKYGLIDLDKLEKSIKPGSLVSIIFANNEIGTIQDIKEIGKICHKKGALFHTDAVQAYGKIPIDVKKMNIDFLSASSHKIYGPKGVGLLYIRNGLKIEPISHGGGHEKGIRSGTENIPGIVGFAEASDICRREMKKEAKQITRLRDYLIKSITQIENSWLNGHPKQRLPNNANFSFKYIEGEALVLHLDFEGIAASTGSACSTKSLEPSHVLTAIGLKPEEAHGSLRLTLGRFNTKKEIDYTCKVIPKVVERLRKISPIKG